MSSQTPPNPWFNQINYNPNFFSNGSSGNSTITLSYLNANYLRISNGVIQINSPITLLVSSIPTSTTLSQIGSNKIVTGSQVISAGAGGAGFNSASITLPAGSYMLVGSVSFSLVLTSPITWISWGCFFNDSVGAISTTLGTPYYGSRNYYNALTSPSTFANTTNTSGLVLQSIMPIVLTVQTTVYLNMVCNFSAAGNTMNAISQIMATRIA